MLRNNHQYKVMSSNLSIVALRCACKALYNKNDTTIQYDAITLMMCLTLLYLLATNNFDLVHLLVKQCYLVIGTQHFCVVFFTRVWQIKHYPLFPSLTDSNKQHMGFFICMSSTSVCKCLVKLNHRDDYTARTRICLPHQYNEVT